jgi:succinate dehydrogenase / fumarate reductase cytochrome b subunit
MSSTAPSKRTQPVNSLPSGKGVLDWVKPFFTTTVGMKVTTAITGTVLTLFVVGHLIGNLKLLGGQDALNSYAHFLQGLGVWLWVARGSLLAALVVHMTLALYLKKKALAARPVGYAHPNTVVASYASRTMAWTGAVIFAFLLFHLAHYTFGLIGTVEAHNYQDPNKVAHVRVGYLDLIDDKGRHDVYSMTVAGFRQPVIAALYVVAQLFLLFHLSHGIASVFQTLGLNTPRVQPFIRRLSWTVATLLAAGNIGLVTAVYMDWLGEDIVPRTKAGLPPPPPPPPGMPPPIPVKA